MKKPKMILFDYGQTLIDEEGFDGVKGTNAVLQYASENKYGKTAEEVQAFADELNTEMGRFDPAKKHLFQLEVPNFMFTKYLYEMQGIKLSIDSDEIDRIFWNNATSKEPTEGIEDFLKFLQLNHIRTGVISNISYSGAVVAERIQSCLPSHTFEFIITSSDYMYRKPNQRIFDLALEKAKLSPEDIWFIGDQYMCDVAGSRTAGMFPVWYLGAVDFHQEKKDDVLTVTSFEELKEIMKKEFPEMEKNK